MLMSDWSSDVCSSDLPLKPISVFDDGRRVYVVFPRGIVQGEMPPIFVIGSDGETQIVNSRIHQNILIVDRLFGAAELRLGSGDRQQTVRIVRIEQRQAAQPRSEERLVGKEWVSTCRSRCWPYP